MKSSNIKIIICLMWLIGVVGFVVVQRFSIVQGKNNESISSIPKPDLKEVEKFNALILNRFLTDPQLGMRRIIPPNVHLDHFVPKNQEEKASVNYFEEKGWKVGVFLYGRIFRDFRSISKHLSFNYRTNEPVPITRNVKVDDLPYAEDFLPSVAKAFNEFQNDEKSDEKTFEFESAGWWYLAKPVRAVNQSCVDCHRSYVPVKSKGKYPFELRPRLIGDVNGVLIYAFQKAKK